MLLRKLVLSSSALFLLLSLVFSVEASSTMWSTPYGDADQEVAQSLVETSDGGYALAGSTRSNGAGEEDFWVVKTDAYGNMEWNRTYGGYANDECAYSLVDTSDGGYAIAGSTSSGAGSFDFWLIKVDGYGNYEWSRTYGGPGYERAKSLVTTSDGGYALAGDTRSYGAGEDDVWLVKTGANGNMEWSRTYGGPGSDSANSLVVTSDGGYAVAGSTSNSSSIYSNFDFWLIKTDADGNMEWNQTYDSRWDHASSVVVTSDGGFAIVGAATSGPFPVGVSWLVKTDANGNMEWNQSYDVGLRSLVVTFDGGYALAGFVTSFPAGDGIGNNDVWLVKTDAHGNMEWNQTYGGLEDDEANSLIVTSDGGYALAGYTGSFGAGDYDFWLMKTDEYGIIPEFQFQIILQLFLTATFSAIMLKKRLFHHQS